MLADALTFPRTADGWLGTLAVGTVLSLLGFLVLPAVVVQGYLVRVARAAATGGRAPSFTDWGALLVDGLRLLALYLLAGLVVAVPAALAFGVAGVSGGLTGSRAGAGAVGLLGLLAAGMLALVVVYLLPAATTNFAVEDSLAAAFDRRAVVGGALTGDYATAWLLALLVGVVGGLVGSALTAILVGFVVLFYLQVVVYYLFGRGFAAGDDASDGGPDGQPATPTGPAGRPQSDGTDGPAGRTGGTDRPVPDRSAEDDGDGGEREDRDGPAGR